MAISCSPIKPGGGSSTEVNSAGAKVEDSGNDSESNDKLGEDSQEEESDDAITGNGSIPSSQSSNDTALTERYNFAAVCGPLFGMSNDEAGPREGVLTNDEEGVAEDDSSQSPSSSNASCLEGPSISSFQAVQAFAEYDQRKADCVAADGFWDSRGDDSNNPGETGECFDVEASSSGLFCDFKELDAKMGDVFGIQGFIEGYQHLGWQVEQCVFSPSGPYLTLSTVVVDKNQNLAHLISKVAFLESISVVCEGKSGGVCDQIDDPNAEVLFVSAPLTIRSKTVDELNQILAK